MAVPSGARLSYDSRSPATDTTWKSCSPSCSLAISERHLPVSAYIFEPDTEMT